jgi:hypothetical protein
VCIAYIVILSFFEWSLYEKLADDETASPVEICGSVPWFEKSKDIRIPIRTYLVILCVCTM